MLCECLHYAQLLWIKLGEFITKYLNSVSTDYVPKVEHSHLNIIFNVPHPSLLIHIPDKLSRNTILILTQEIKRDIIYRRLNLPPWANQTTDPPRLAAHLNFSSDFTHTCNTLDLPNMPKRLECSTGWWKQPGKPLVMPDWNGTLIVSPPHYFSFILFSFILKHHELMTHKS
jgi:hypothetical protein